MAARARASPASQSGGGETARTMRWLADMLTSDDGDDLATARLKTRQVGRRFMSPSLWAIVGPFIVDVVVWQQVIVGWR